MKHRFFGAAILLIIVWPLSARAQTQLGFEFGVGRHAQSGEVLDSCGCSPNNGIGTGFSAALSVEVPFYFGFRAGVKAQMDSKKTSGTMVVFDSLMIQDASGGVDTILDLPVNHFLDVSTTYLAISPYLSYTLPGTGLFVQLGASVSDLISSQLTERRSLASTSTIINGQTINDLRLYNGSRSQTIADGAITDANQFRVAAIVSAGYEIQISRSILAPMITFDAPITNIRSVNASNWKISSLYGTIALKFGL